jgi:hypothetical protein
MGPVDRVHELGSRVHETIIKYRPPNSRSKVWIKWNERVSLVLIYVVESRIDGVTHFLRMIKFCRSNSALGCILKINSIG